MLKERRQIRLLKRIILSALIIFAVGVCGPLRATPVASADSTLKFSFMAISDIHTPSYDTNLVNALQDSAANNCSALCLLGDLTSHGSDAEYDELMSIMNSNPHPPAYYIVGNHDVRWLTGGYTEAKDRFLAKTGMPAMYYDRWVNGYHFIFLATEQDLKDQAYLSATQLSWLDAKLADQAAVNKPVFIFLHQPLANTINGTYLEDGYGQSYPNGVVQDKELKAILAQYPQAILTTGHTHYAAQDSNLYSAMYCNMINDGSITQGQGLIFDVYGDRVEIRGRDFTGKTTIMSWTVPYSLPAFSPTAYYKLINRNSGKAMDVRRSSMENSADVMQYPYGGGNNQQWRIVDAGGGYYKLINRNSGKLADVQGGSLDNGAKIIQYTDNGGANQLWILVSTGGGYYKLINKNSGKVIDVPNSSTDSIALTQYTDKLGANQQWSIAKVS